MSAATQQQRGALGEADRGRERFVLALDWACDPKQLRAWLKSAVPGDERMYAAGWKLPVDAEAVRLAREWAEQGTVILWSRVDPEDKRRRQWLIVKPRRLPEPKPAPAPRARLKAAMPDELRPLFDLLERCARRGEPCPSYAEIRRKLGLRSRWHARHLMQRLIGRGDITVESRGRNLPRVVTIVRGGLETKR